MRGSLAMVLVSTLAGLLGFSDVSGQVTIGVGAGGTFPVGDYADFDGAGGGDAGAGPGWMAAAGLGVPLGELPISVGVLGFFGSNGHDADGDETDLYGGLAEVSYTFDDFGLVSPFLGGLGGFMRRSFQSETQPGLEASVSGWSVGAAGGAAFPLRGVAGFVQGFWLTGLGDVDAVQIFGVMAGVQVAIGGAT